MGAQGICRESMFFPRTSLFVERPLGLGFTPRNSRKGSTGHDVSTQPGEGTLGRASLILVRSLGYLQCEVTTYLTQGLPERSPTC